MNQWQLQKKLRQLLSVFHCSTESVSEGFETQMDVFYENKYIGSFLQNNDIQFSFQSLTVKYIWELQAQHDKIFSEIENVICDSILLIKEAPL